MLIYNADALAKFCDRPVRALIAAEEAGPFAGCIHAWQVNKFEIYSWISSHTWTSLLTTMYAYGWGPLDGRCSHGQMEAPRSVPNHWFRGVSLEDLVYPVRFLLWESDLPTAVEERLAVDP